ncbi:MAG: DMT family transporter [Caulobacterales bacterium]
MSAIAIAAALFSALIHARWMALLKTGSDRLVDSALVAIGWTIVSLALIALTGMPPRETWPILIASGVVHAGYWAAMSKGYESGDLSHVYTLSRGLAPVFVTLGGFLFLHESLEPAAMFGIATVCVGVLSVGASPNAPLRATIWSLLTAVAIGGYSLIDAFGARQTGNPALYLGWGTLLAALPIIVFAIWRRGATTLLRAAQNDWMRGLSAGFISMLGYGMILYAQTLAPVAQVAALREASVVFGALIAWLFLKEKLGARRWAGACVVALGAVFIAFT